MIDWNAPLEAVHTDGRVVPVYLDSRFSQPDEDGDYRIELIDSGVCYFEADGTHTFGSKWRLRNVAPTASPDQTHRMVNLIKRMATNNYMDTADYKDARAIAAELTERTDPRIAVVEEVLSVYWLGREHISLAARGVLTALDGIRK